MAAQFAPMDDGKQAPEDAFQVEEDAQDDTHPAARKPRGLDMKVSRPGSSKQKAAAAAAAASKAEAAAAASKAEAAAAAAASKAEAAAASKAEAAAASKEAAPNPTCLHAAN
jgi:hypothetical protein